MLCFDVPFLVFVFLLIRKGKTDQQWSLTVGDYVLRLHGAILLFLSVFFLRETFFRQVLSRCLKRIFQEKFSFVSPATRRADLIFQSSVVIDKDGTAFDSFIEIGQ